MFLSNIFYHAQHQSTSIYMVSICRHIDILFDAIMTKNSFYNIDISLIETFSLSIYWVLCVNQVIIAMETGIIPPNINFTKIRSGIKALEDGRLRVIAEPTPWKPDLVGINSFGFGGATVHLLLQPNLKKKINNGMPNDHLPRLIAMSGRTKETLESFFHDVCT